MHRASDLFQTCDTQVQQVEFVNNANKERVMTNVMDTSCYIRDFVAARFCYGEYLWRAYPHSFGHCTCCDINTGDSRPKIG